MSRIDVGAALRRARESGPATMVEVLASAADELGATDLVVYLVDFGQTTLEPLPDRALHADVSASEPVGTTMAGKAFIDQQVLTAERDDGVRVWIPVLEGSDRTGVVALTLPNADEGLLQECEQLGLLAGYLIAAQHNRLDLRDDATIVAARWHGPTAA